MKAQTEKTVLTFTAEDLLATKSIFIPAAQVPPGLWLKGKPEAVAPPPAAKSPEQK